MKVLFLRQFRLSTVMAALIFVVAAPRFAIARQSLVPPTARSVLPDNAGRGSNFTAVINGSDLAGATSVIVSGTGIAVSIVSNTSPSALTVSISISETTSMGLRSLTVITPAGNSYACFCLTVTNGQGRWTDAGRMVTSRSYHTATLLNDGRVLVAGGHSDRDLELAEIYDPATKTWTSTGSLGATRESHTATLLPNGNVLVVGGRSESRFLQSAEIYDPATGRWTPAGFMSVPRVGHTATLLPNGLVLVAGGGTANSSELYNPATGQFTTTGPMNLGRRDHSAVLLSNGTVLVAGGLVAGVGRSLTAEIYDPTTSRWTYTGSMISSPTTSGVLLPANNKVLIPDYPTSQLYDPISGSWGLTAGVVPVFPSSLGLQFFPRSIPIVLRNGKVLVTGRWFEGPFRAYRSAELYDPASGAWDFTSPGIVGGPATLLNDGTVLVTEFGASIYDPDASLSVNPAPTVERVEVDFPDGWRTGLETVTIKIVGSDFVVGSQVLVGQTVLPTTSVSSSTITASIPGPLFACAGPQNLVVKNPGPGGGNSATVSFNVRPATPTITAISPQTGVPGSSFTMTVTGTNLCEATTVIIGGARASGASATVAPGSTATSLSLLVTIAANAEPGPQPITIWTARSGESAAFNGFVILPASIPALPLITAITPQTAVARTSFTMTVTGTNLSGATAARFDGFGIVATIQPGGTATSLSLLVTVGDPLPLGSRTLTITTPGGTSAPFSGFTVLPPSSPPSNSPQRIPEVEDGNVQTGYLVITPDQNTSAPFTTLTYGTVRNGIVQDQANVVPLGVTTGATLFIDFLNSASRNVGLVIVNPGGTTNAITITLKNNDGTTASTATVNIDPYKQVAKFVNELFPAAVGPAFTGTINIQSGSPFAVLGFPFAGTNFSTFGAANTGTLAAVPTRTLTSGNIGGANALVLPQFAMGGGWATQVALINPSGTAATGRIDVFDTNGQPKAVKLNGDTRSTFTYSIPAGGTFLLGPRDENGQTPM